MVPHFLKLFSQQMMFSLLVITILLSQCFTKSTFRQEDPDLGNQTITLQAEEIITAESGGVKSSKDGILSIPVAHHRTARDFINPCFLRSQRKWDSCRQKYVEEDHCLRQHATCYGALAQGYNTTACKAVIGYRAPEYISKCPPLQIDCQCAAKLKREIRSRHRSNEST